MYVLNCTIPTSACKPSLLCQRPDSGCCASAVVAVLKDAVYADTPMWLLLPEDLGLATRASYVSL